MLDNIKVGKRLMEARKNKAFTLKEVSDKIGIASSTIARYEIGRIEKLKLPVIEALARCLEVNPLWILGKSESKEIEDNIILSLSKQEKELVDTYRILNNSGKEKAQEYITDLSEQEKYTK